MSSKRPREYHDVETGGRQVERDGVFNAERAALASGLTRQGDMLRLSPESLSAKDRKDAPKLKALIQAAVQTGTGKGTDSGSTIRLGDPAGDALYLLVSPVRSQHNLMGGSESTVCAAVTM